MAAVARPVAAAVQDALEGLVAVAAVTVLCAAARATVPQPAAMAAMRAAVDVVPADCRDRRRAVWTMAVPGARDLVLEARAD